VGARPGPSRAKRRPGGRRQRTADPRLHDGALRRTQETLAFQHAADGAATLLAAAVAYERIARAADAMVTAGGHLLNVDNGRLFISYGRT
jgi:hypothetical protein